ncbi:MAG: phosphodiester glycosidase family protein [Rhizobiaceae bacterium]
MFGRQIFILTLLIFFGSVVGAAAQNAIQMAPERSRMVVEALQNSEWKPLKSGMDGMEVQAGSVSLMALRIDPSKFAFSLMVQSGPDGERVENFGERSNAVVAINGGFFGEKEPGKDLFSVGYLKIGKLRHSKAWSKSGGYLVIRDGNLAIVPTMAGVPKNAEAILQSKPLLIEPGGIWAMNTNQSNMRRRSIVCLQKDNTAILVVVTGLGMSLFEAGWLMREGTVGGYFDCDSALALDGGGSTQIWMRNEKLSGVRGENAVHNALLINNR